MHESDLGENTFQIQFGTFSTAASMEAYENMRWSNLKSPLKIHCLA